jgi:hypothetical protein
VHIDPVSIKFRAHISIFANHAHLLSKIGTCIKDTHTHFV